jgi:hypothetical protein
MPEPSMIWTWMVIGVFAAVPLSILAALWKVVAWKRELTAALADLRGLQEALEEIPASDVLWNGDKAYSADVPIEEIEHRIREALNLRRLEEASKKDLLNVV